MSELAIAGMVFSFLVALAIAAPIWGVDSRDGVESDQPSRRVAWLHDRPAPRSGRSASVLVAGALRNVAHSLDADLAAEHRQERRLAEVC
jgi:hypothetical protein